MEPKFYFYKGNLFLNHDLSCIKTFSVTASCPRTPLKIFIFGNPCLQFLFYFLIFMFSSLKEDNLC